MIDDATLLTVNLKQEVGSIYDLYFCNINT